jgi:hypothetical protein
MRKYTKSKDPWFTFQPGQPFLKKGLSYIWGNFIKSSSGHSAVRPGSKLVFVCNKTTTQAERGDPSSCHKQLLFTLEVGRA